jgi:hypothetical protein
MCVIQYWLYLQGYSYVSPAILHSENEVSDELFEPTADNCPISAHHSSYKFRVGDDMHPLIFKKSYVLNCEESTNYTLEYKIHADVLFTRTFQEFVTLGFILVVLPLKL